MTIPRMWEGDSVNLIAKESLELRKQTIDHNSYAPGCLTYLNVLNAEHAADAKFHKSSVIYK